MDRAGTVQIEGTQVLGGGIALVAGEAVGGIDPVIGAQQPVAKHLGDDGGGGNRQAASVPLHQRFAVLVQAGNGQTIHQNAVGGGVERVEGEAHGPVRGPQDIDPVDLLGLDDADTHGQRFPSDPGLGLFAGGGGEFLGVGDAGRIEVGRKNDGGGDDRAGEGPAARLVHPRHPPPAPRPTGPLRIVVHGAMWWARARGQNTQSARPMTRFAGSGPHLCESCESLRLSPITNR